MDGAVEEDQVTGAEIGLRDRPAVVVLQAAGVRQLHPDLGIAVHHETRTVEAARATTPPNVTYSQIAFGQ